MFKLKKHIAFLFIVVLLTPITIQNIHAIEDNHEHIACKAVKEKHFHKLKFNCSNLHLQLESFSSDITSSFNVIPQHYYSQDFNKQPQKTKVVYISKKSSRAPPIFTV